MASPQDGISCNFEDLQEIYDGHTGYDEDQPPPDAAATYRTGLPPPKHLRVRYEWSTAKEKWQRKLCKRDAEPGHLQSQRHQNQIWRLPEIAAQRRHKQDSPQRSAASASASSQGAVAAAAVGPPPPGAATAAAPPQLANQAAAQAVAAAPPPTTAQPTPPPPAFCSSQLDRIERLAEQLRQLKGQLETIQNALGDGWERVVVDQ